MPVHDWTCVDKSIFHSFHIGWGSEIGRALNNGLLPDRFYALSETFINEPGFGYVYAVRAVAVHHSDSHRPVAMVQIVSPESKNDGRRLREFVRKTQDLLAAGIHLLLVDLFPPGKHDPHGINGAIWEALTDKTLHIPQDKPLTMAAYTAGQEPVLHIEPVAVGNALPDMPLFLAPNTYISIPLEATYQAEWRGMPKRWRDVLEAPGHASAGS